MPIRTADLSDEQGEAWQSSPLQWRTFGGRTRFEGVISTVQCRDDNALVRVALSEPGAARVLVVDGGGSLGTALVGDVLAGLAVANCWAGIVVHGAVRDVVALADLDLGVLGLGTNPRRGGRDGTGVRDVLRQCTSTRRPSDCRARRRRQHHRARDAGGGGVVVGEVGPAVQRPRMASPRVVAL